MSFMAALVSLRGPWVCYERILEDAEMRRQMKRPTKDELIEIGRKINNSIQAVWTLSPTIKEMEALETYMQQQETILPLLDPTFIAQHGFKIFDQAKERMELLKPILQLKEKEKAGK